MDVLIDVEGKDPVPNVVSIDTIVRFGPRSNGSGTYIRLTDGNSIEVIDPFDEIKKVVLTAEAKKGQG